MMSPPKVKFFVFLPILFGFLDSASSQPARSASSVSVEEPVQPAVPRPLPGADLSLESLTIDSPGEAETRKEIPPQAPPEGFRPRSRLNLIGIDRTDFPDVLLVFGLTVNGRPETELAPEQLELTEDEAPQEILDLQPCVPETIPGEPLSVMMLIDSSGSMQVYLDVIQNAAARFVDRLQEDDQAGVMAFCSEPIVLEPLTTNKKRVDRAIYEIVPRGFTALYDSLQLGLRLLANCPGKKAVILVTDGKDDDGAGAPLSTASIEDVIGSAKRWRIPVFTIGLGADIEPVELKKIGEETGGEFLFAPSGHEVDRLYQEVASRLGRGEEGYFCLTYRTTQPQRDNTDRTVILKYGPLYSTASYPAPRSFFWPLSEVFN